MSEWYKVTFIDMPNSEFEGLVEVVLRKVKEAENFKELFEYYGLPHVHEWTYGLGLEYFIGINENGEFEMIPSEDVVEVVKV